MANKVVRSEVIETGFGFYTDEDVKNLSVCKVTSPVSTDALNNPLSSGLYDPKMGPQDMFAQCVTCNLSYVNCPGHCGHIELDVQVYHPLFFPALFQLLRSKCAFCHKLRMSAARVRHYLIKLKLFEMGETKKAEAFDDMVSPPQIFEDSENTWMRDLETRLKLYEEKFGVYCARKDRKPVDLHVKASQRTVIEEFQKKGQNVKKCENCDAISPAYRKDGFSKIFQKPLSKKTLRALAAMRLKLKSGLEAMAIEAEGGARMDDSDVDDTSDEADEDDDIADEGPTEADKYLPPVEVEAQVKLLWINHADILDFIWSRATNCGKPSLVANPEGWRIFFSRTVLVPPNRFRPLARVGEAVTEHPHNIHLSKIISANERIKKVLMAAASDRAEEILRSENLSALEKQREEKRLAVSGEEEAAAAATPFGLTRVMTDWIELQTAVNCFMDSAKDPNPLGGNAAPPGLRQLLERKEGLFRRHMMGKRVNYCCRSVISPDPFIGTNEVGIPIHFAKTLHYPTPVNDWNVKLMRKLVINGPSIYPGANQIEYGDGKIVNLEKLSDKERSAKARLLMSTPGTKVYRHLVDGDTLLVNRQPTLHKPGIMAHKARVFRHMREQTLRLSYANCSSYNADFDGDEMNCHFVQNELARAEANFLCNTDNQYIVPTSGNPLRGLIQDHVASGVKLTCKKTFLNKGQFQQLLYIAVSGLPGTEIVAPVDSMVMPIPAILKPEPMWTGKQVVSALMRHLCRPPLPPLQLDGKTRTPPTAFGADQNEHIIVIRNGELLCGVIDKASIGSSSLGIVHAVYELYGAEFAGRLLNAFGRLFTFYLQDAGQTCGIEDLTLTAKADEERSRLLDKVTVAADRGLQAFLEGDEGTAESKAKFTSNRKKLTEKEKLVCQEKVARLIAADRHGAKIVLDGAMQGVINKAASEVIKACIPGGLEKPFLTNHFSMMVLTGAKGSAVNQSQISCFLGQQALEGQRVPMMVSGKTLPSFRPFDASARSGGFIRDRFLTGVKPQEYYFHCMAGREGLVDTAVKTSRSGYLQRCLVKHLEELRVHYDMTVRDSGSNVIQFLYGEDGLDPVNTSLLGGKDPQMLFLARNNQALVHKYSLHHQFFSQNMLDLESGQKHHRLVRLAREQLAKGQGGKISKGCVMMVRRRKSKELPWGPSNITGIWEAAEVIKVHKSDERRTYDLKYPDGEVEKKVPASIMVKPRTGSRRPIGPLGLSTDITGSKFNAGSGPPPRAPFPMRLMKAGLPATAMSYLRLDNCVGAVSEKIQDAVTSYATRNPDGAVGSSSTTTVTGESLELLIWIKYMRSLACPGEAVGCVAAQSIGEPSTQMTLNTFHLAGHGGANVTLGIPRLREILMTASKSPKTPTMTIPLARGQTMATAKTVARSLSRLPMAILLNHQGGIEVTESLKRSSGGRWERVYDVALMFESISKIKSTFGVEFQDIMNSVKSTFLDKLTYWVKMEQRRAGEKKTNPQDLLSEFRSKKDGTRTKNTEEGEAEGAAGGDDSGDEGGGAGKKGNKKGSGKKDDGLHDDEDEEEDDEDELDDAEQGTLRLGRHKEMTGYADDSDEEDVQAAPTDGDDIEADSDDGVRVDGSDDDDDSGVASPRVTPSSKSTPKLRVEALDDSDDDDVGPSSRGKGMKSAQKSDKGAKSPKTPAGSSVARKKMGKSDGSFCFSEEEGWAQVTLSFPAHMRRLLMVQIAEKAASVTNVRATKNISQAYAVPVEVGGQEGVGVQTEGVNFEAAWALPSSMVMSNDIKCNDVWGVLQTFGVEAARQTIVAEVMGVFGVYGIDVNPRHLSLIADFMTRSGSYVAMNRIGMKVCPSPFLQMSFETTCTFLVKAAQEGHSDLQESPSARIVLGSPTKVGTGCFDLMLPLQGPVYKEKERLKLRRKLKQEESTDPFIYS